VVQHDYAAPSGGSVPDCDNQQIENGSRCSMETAITKKSGGDLHNYLRHKGKRYRKRDNNKDSRGQIVDAVSIDERPEIVDQNSRIGDWKIDTVIGKNHKQAIVTIVERASKFSVMKKVENSRCSGISQD